MTTSTQRRSSQAPEDRASVGNVKRGWIQYAKERNWSELLTLFVDAGVSADEFLDEEQARAARRLPPTPREKEIQDLLN